MEAVNLIRYHVLPYWKSILVVLLPVIFSPLLVINDGKEAKAGYAILLVAVFWMTEAMPLPAASLLPVVLLPLLGVMSTGKVCKAYLNETTMMFIGSLMVALTVEYCNLHKRVALKVLLYVGTSPRWLILGFMVTTMVLSMWISNTATTAMMVPIVDAVIRELYKDENIHEDKAKQSIIPIPSSSSVTALVPSDSSVSLDLTLMDQRQGNALASEDVNSSQTPSENQQLELSEEGNNMRKCALLAVAYASNIGGTATLIGSGSNLVLKGVFKDLYERAPGLNFATWMAFNVPGMIINIFFAWIWLQFLFIGFKSAKGEGDKAVAVRKVLKVKYDDLGPLSFHEFATATLFSLCVLLWFFRDPQFIPGWAEYFTAVKVDDATTAIAIVILLFVIPSKPKFWCLRSTNEVGRERPSSALLDWAYVQEKLPWGIVLLLGGGFALSDASRSSGLSSWIGAQLTGLQALPPFAIMIVICIMTATVTEVASNTATTNILLPILSEMALTIKVNPLYLMIPATVTCSYAFMLPVATPPNAIIFAASKMNPKDMVKAGFMMNIICVMVICLSMATFGNFMFHCDKFPDWALPVPQELAAAPMTHVNCSATI